MIFLVHNFLCVKTGSMYFPFFLHTCLILDFLFSVSDFYNFASSRGMPKSRQNLLQLALVYVYVPEQLSLVDSLPQNSGRNSCTFVPNIPIYNVQKAVHSPI
jgi:hypothetical protein